MPRFLITGFFALALLSTPAGACDPDDLVKEFKAICHDFVTATNAGVARVHARLSTEDKQQLEAATRLALDACEAQTFSEAARHTARLGILIGHFEARNGLEATLDDGRRVAAR
jgi:hypothetical protein